MAATNRARKVKDAVSEDAVVVPTPAIGDNAPDYNEAEIIATFERVKDAKAVRNMDVVAHFAKAAGKGVPEPIVVGWLTGAGYDPKDAKTRGAYSDYLSALVLGEARMDSLRALAKALRAADPEIMTSEKAYTMKLAKVARKHPGMKDEALAAMKEATPTRKHDAERGAAYLTQALNSLDNRKVAMLLGLTGKRKEKFLAHIEALAAYAVPGPVIEGEVEEDDGEE